MKRGQSEIIGLVVVVLILVFALIFFVKIKNSDSEDESKLIRFNLRANSALNALMKVHTTYGNERMQMKELIEKCVLAYNPPPPPEDVNYVLPDECNTLKENDLKINLDIIFDNSKEYHLIVSEGDDDIFSLGDGCRNSISASPFILRNGGKVEFKICT